MSLAEVSLQARRRDETGKGVARRLRRAGRIPAVVYGKNMESVPLSLDAHDAAQLFHSIPVANTVLQLDIGDGETFRTLVREIQTHPFRPDILHVDFMRLRRGVAIELNVPISLAGTPAGIREGGNLEIVAHEVQVRCTPANIPESLHVDISGLGLGESLQLGDVTLPEGVELLADPKAALCQVARIQIEEEPEGEADEEVEVEEEAPEEL